MENTKQALRPSFTKKIYDRLCKGQSLNLVGVKGTGRTRLLHDISQMAITEQVIPLVIDLKTYVYSYERFQEDVLSQLSQKTEQIALQISSTPLLQPLVTQTEQEVHLSKILRTSIPETKRLFLLLDNFDSILDQEDCRFPQSFYDDLNALKNRENISLCCNTQKSHLHSIIHCKDNEGIIHRKTSWLELQVIDLPRLQLEEIRTELNRSMKNLSAWQNEQQKERFVDEINAMIPQMLYIQLLKESFEMEENISADARLKRIKNKYTKHYKAKEISFFSFDNFLEKAKKLTDIWKNIKS